MKITQQIAFNTLDIDLMNANPYIIMSKIGWNLALFSKLEHFNGIVLTRTILQCAIFSIL